MGQPTFNPPLSDENLAKGDLRLHHLRRCFVDFTVYPPTARTEYLEVSLLVMSVQVGPISNPL